MGSPAQGAFSPLVALNLLPSHHLPFFTICNAYLRDQLKFKFKPQSQREENGVFLSLFGRGSIKQNN